VPTLYLVRHGETDWNAQGRLQGWRDIPLNDRGRGQAAEAAERIRALVPDPARLAYVTSPLSRARETMEILRRTLGLDASGYRADERLKEIAFGAWEGLTWKEIRRADPGGAGARERDRWGFRPPRGESYPDATARIAPALDDLEADAVLVCHGGTTRVIVAHLCDVAPERVPRMEVWQGRVLVVEGGRHRWA
jgi:probable phosphoglycerate mutase